jgi:large subunit ribosomal protein L9
VEVILLKDQRHLGTRGEVIKVKPGFARNFLLPQGIALEATPGNMKVFESIKTKIDALHSRERDAARAIAEKLDGLRVEVAKRVGETETLYGSVTASEVAELLEAKGFEVDRRRIDLEGGIKTVGDHEVRIDLHAEVEAKIVVTVVPEE